MSYHHATAAAANQSALAHLVNVERFFENGEMKSFTILKHSHCSELCVVDSMRRPPWYDFLVEEQLVVLAKRNAFMCM